MGEFAVIPGKFAGFDEDARDRIAMAPNELGCRMHDNVGPMLKGPAQIRRGKSVIDDERQAGFMGNAGNGSYVKHVSTWVAYRFAVQGAWSVSSKTNEVV